MSEQTKIQWADSTVNFWSGCTKVSDGCAHCYAEAMDRRHLVEQVNHWGKGAPRLVSHGAVKMALALNLLPWIENHTGKAFSNEELAPGFNPEWYHRRRIFSLSRGDWLDEEVPIERLAEMLDTIRRCDQVIWLLLTKRPENWESQLNEVLKDWVQRGNRSDGFRHFIQEWLNGNPPANVWFGFSAENQQCLDVRWHHAKQIAAPVHFISVEPMLAAMDFMSVIHQAKARNITLWPIFGGESGLGARACNVQWIRDGMKQFQAAAIKVFVKQLGAKPAGLLAPFGEDGEMCEVGLRDKKGGDLAEWPEDLRVREFPNLGQPAKNGLDKLGEIIARARGHDGPPEQPLHFSNDAVHES